MTIPDGISLSQDYPDLNATSKLSMSTAFAPAVTDSLTCRLAQLLVPEFKDFAYQVVEIYSQGM